MVRVRPKSLRKKTYRSRSQEDRCPVCGNPRLDGDCQNPYCTEYGGDGDEEALIEPEYEVDRFSIEK